MNATSPAPATERLAKRLAIAVGVLTVLTAASLWFGITAGRRAADTSGCVNSILGVRAPLTTADHANERQKIDDQIVAERDKANGLTKLAAAKTQPEGAAAFRLYQQGVDEFIQALNDWKTRDDRIAAEKRLHPLGKC